MSRFAWASPRSIRFASSTSSAAVSRSTLPMSFRKSCSESVEALSASSRSISASGDDATTSMCCSSSAA
jgi:hypothetical protein